MSPGQPETRCRIVQFKTFDIVRQDDVTGQLDMLVFRDGIHIKVRTKTPSRAAICACDMPVLPFAICSKAQ